jgi:hypothetical protein
MVEVIVPEGVKSIATLHRRSYEFGVLRLVFRYQNGCSAVG